MNMQRLKKETCKGEKIDKMKHLIGVHELDKVGKGSITSIQWNKTGKTCVMINVWCSNGRWKEKNR